MIPGGRYGWIRKRLNNLIYLFKERLGRRVWLSRGHLGMHICFGSSGRKIMNSFLRILLRNL
jgi:hypothetical protein